MSRMAVEQVECPAEIITSSFKPPHLDKIVWLFRLTGVVHNSKPLWNLKQLALLLYNISVICIHAMITIVSVIFLQQMFLTKSTHVYQYIEVISGMINHAFLVYFIIHLILLSRRSRLSLLPRPDHWYPLPDYYEKQTTLFRKIILVFSLLMAIFVSSFYAFYFILKPQEC